MINELCHALCRPFTPAARYGEGVLRGWCPGNHCGGPGGQQACGSPATNCYVYNATFHMLGDKLVCNGLFEGSLLDTSTIHVNRSGPIPNITAECQSAATAAVRVEYLVSDATITAQAKQTLGAYPRPYTPSP